MATLAQIIADLNAKAAAEAKAEATADLPDLRDDPWFYLDPEHGDERLRRYLGRDDPLKR
jgi:hypothetical protein